MRTADEARELLDQIRIMADAMFHEVTAVSRVFDECAKDGYTQLAHGEKVTTSGISDPVYALVMAPDEVADDRDSYLDFIRWAWKGLNGGRHLSSKYAAIDARMAKAASAGDGLRFECCNVYGCPDSLPAESGRDGRCYTCYRYRLRNGGRDRKRRYDRDEVA